LEEYLREVEHENAVKLECEFWGQVLCKMVREFEGGVKVGELLGEELRVV
jgi:hypothetical protein